MSKRIYDINENYFEDINTEHKAYFLGFIYADGGIQSREFKNMKYRLQICLKNGCSERDLLNELKNELEYTGDIKTRTRKNGYEVCCLDLHSKKLITDLLKHGVSCQKTDIIKFPTTVPIELRRHFIRGFFDGDGCISPRKDRPNGFKVELCCANYNFLKSIVNIFKIDLGIECNITTYNKTKNPLYRISKDKNAGAVILEYLYYDSNVYLKRKYNLYQKFTAPLNINIQR